MKAPVAVSCPRSSVTPAPSPSVEICARVIRLPFGSFLPPTAISVSAATPESVTMSCSVRSRPWAAFAGAFLLGSVLKTSPAYLPYALIAMLSSYSWQRISTTPVSSIRTAPTSTA